MIRGIEQVKRPQFKASNFHPFRRAKPHDYYPAAILQSPATSIRGDICLSTRLQIVITANSRLTISPCQRDRRCHDQIVNFGN